MKETTQKKKKNHIAVKVVKRTQISELVIWMDKLIKTKYRTYVLQIVAYVVLLGPDAILCS